MILRFRGGTPTDIAYVGQDWLPAWAAAGFLAPLDDVAPKDVLDALKADMAPFALSDETYNGKVYGLPYYADTISFIYNKKILEAAGIAVPTTWDEVMAAAEKLKAGGMEHPIVYEFDQELPNFWDAFVAQSYGRGGDLFDADNKAVFDNPDGPAYKQLEWLQEAFKKDLVQQETHESKIIPSMNTGKHAFTIVYNYVLAAMNNAAEQPMAGDFALAPMPGDAHQTLGFTKFYSITRLGGGRPGAGGSGLEVRELHGRQALHGRPALGGREGPRLRPGAALRRSRGHRLVGQVGRHDHAQGAGGDRPRRHLDRVDERLVGLFPAAPRQGHGRRGHRRGDDEGRRRQVERIPGKDGEELT